MIIVGFVKKQNTVYPAVENDNEVVEDITAQYGHSCGVGIEENINRASKNLEVSIRGV